VVYRLRAYDADGDPLGDPTPELTLPRLSQKQFQGRELKSLFALDGLSDYRVEVETVSGGPVFAWGNNVRQGSQDPSYIGGGAGGVETAWLLGVQKQRRGGTDWITDVVLSNPSDEELELTLGYRESGVNTAFRNADPITLGPGESRRIADVVSLWPQAGSGNGVLRVVGSNQDGAHAIVNGETYDSGKAASETLGASLPALSLADAAGPKQRVVLLGLRHAAGKADTTLWLFNPSGDRGQYELRYRAADGSVIKRVRRFAVPGGKVRSIGASSLPGGAQAFTLEILVKTGQLIAVGQVLDLESGDPSLVVADPR
jgi:hypothetical protein